MEDDFDSFYNKFRADLLKGSPESYYNEEDLIEAYDVASDYNDYFTMLHAVILGKNLFPESEQLELRQGFYLNDTGDDKALDLFLRRNDFRRGIIWDILRLKNKHLPLTALGKKLDEMVATRRFKDDEDIIQFINLVTDCMALDWLADNSQAFIDACDYRDTATSECAHALEASHPAQSIRLFEEFSRIDPFNIETWVKLGELYGRQDNTEEALSAIDYALAIDPENPQARFIRACLIVQRNPADAESLEVFRNQLDLSPDWAPPRINLSLALQATGRLDEAIDLWQPALDNPALVDAATEQLIELSQSAPDNERIDSLLMKSAPYRADEELLTRRIEWLVANDHNDRALTLLEQYDAEIGVYANAFIYIALLYQKGEVERVNEFIERERSDNGPELRLSGPALAMYIASLLRTGRYNDAIEAADDYLTKCNASATNNEFRINFAGFAIIVRQLRELARQQSCPRDNDPIDQYLKLIF